MGDLDGDQVPDLVLVRGGWLEAEIGPGLFDVHLAGIAQVTSFCVCPGAAGAADSILATGPGGLVRLDLDVQSDTWTQVSIAPGWANACFLEIDAQPNGDVSVYAVLQDGRELRKLSQTSTSLSEGPLFTLPVPAKDFTTLDFDGDGELELAVATAGALAVFAQDGTVLKSWVPGGVSSVSIGRIPAPLDGRDWVAWTVTVSNGEQKLWVLGEGGATSPTAMSPLPSIVDMRTGDVDGDGRTDVLFSHTSLHSLVVFLDRGVGPQPVFDYTLPESLYLVPIGPDDTPAPDNEAQPALVDVDGDGDADSLMPVQSSSKVFVGLNAAVDEGHMQPVVDVSDPLKAANLTALASGDLAFDLELAVGHPMPSEATHVELIAWRRASPTQPTDPDSCARTLVDLSTAVVSGAICKLDAQLVLPAPPDMVPGTNVRFQGIYLWLQRPVRVESGAVVRTWPATVHAIETSPFSTNHDWITSVGGVPTFPLHEKSGGTTIPDQIGCGSVLPCLPSFPTGKLPKWN